MRPHGGGKQNEGNSLAKSLRFQLDNPSAIPFTFHAMKTINQTQLLAILRGVTHAQPIAFSALVDARAKKTGNPFGEIQKISRVSAFTGMDYEASVNRQLGREDSQLTFKAKERSWGERVSPALVQNGDKFYLVAKVERAASPVYLVRKPLGRKRTLMLQPIAKEAIAAFLPAHKAATNQGTEKEIVYRNYGLDGITQLSIGGERYRVRRPVAA